MEFMADRFATQFEIGGSLKRKKLEEFVSILQSDGFGLNYEDATAEAMTAEAERRWAHKAIELGAEIVNDVSGSNPAQPNLCQRKRLGVPVESDQVSLGPQPPKNRFGVPGETNGAICVRPVGPHTEKINRLM